MSKVPCLALLLGAVALAGCVVPDEKPTESEFTSQFRDDIASVEIHREDVRVLAPEDELAAALADEALSGLYRVHEWYKEVGIQPVESRALLNASEYVIVTFDEAQYFDFVFKESDGALDAIVVLLEVGDVPREEFIDHLVICFESYCQRLVSDDDEGRRERIEAMTD